MESIGFKEWAVVCEALGRGEQTVILRKGGIAEGRNGFAFRHREFFLFPTFFHEQLACVRNSNAAIPAQQSGEVDIRFCAEVLHAALISEWSTVAALEPMHVLETSVVRERFDYDAPAGVHAAFVRVFRLSEPWRFPDERRYGGCRSWVQLPEMPECIKREPVLNNAESSRRLSQFDGIVNAEVAPELPRH